MRGLNNLKIKYTTNRIILIISVCLLLFFFVVLTRQMIVQGDVDSSSLTPKSEGLSMDKLLEIDAIAWAASVLGTKQGPFCEKKAEVKRKCSECKKAIVTFTRSDCSEYKKTQVDDSCTKDCPVPTQGQAQINYHFATPEENIIRCPAGNVLQNFCRDCSLRVIATSTSDCTVDFKEVYDATCSTSEACQEWKDTYQ